MLTLKQTSTIDSNMVAEFYSPMYANTTVKGNVLGQLNTSISSLTMGVTNTVYVAHQVNGYTTNNSISVASATIGNTAFTYNGETFHASDFIEFNDNTKKFKNISNDSAVQEISGNTSQTFVPALRLKTSAMQVYIENVVSNMNDLAGIQPKIKYFGAETGANSLQLATAANSSSQGSEYKLTNSNASIYLASSSISSPLMTIKLSTDGEN